MSEPLLRNISDTARWVATYRADESEREDALFRDPLARRLAGERGQGIASVVRAGRDPWPFVMRTYLFDQAIAGEIATGASLVLNLAAGLDTRPYRMDLPPSLRWVEVDLPELLDYKEDVLRGETPRCALERVRLDLSDVEARRALFERLGRTVTKVLVVSEGLVIYWTAEEVAALARDLAGPPSFERWVLDLSSPGLLKMLQRSMGQHLENAGVPFKFAPPEGPGFFAPLGWRPLSVRSLLRTAASLGRVPWFMSLLAKLPESSGAQGSRPWSAVCLFGR
jgi:methyltransferase (TIGR00027 family)